MPVVTGTCIAPDGSTIPGCTATIRLITSAADQPGYTAAGEIVDRSQIRADASGAWSATLAPNASITPSGTYYQVEAHGRLMDIVVPVGAGPYEIGSILATPPPTPSAPGITGVQVAIGGTTVGSRPAINLIAGSNATLTAIDNPAASRIDVTLGATGAGTGVTYRGAWSTGTAYAAGDMVERGGERLLCSTAHTSSTPFALTNWADLTSPKGRFNVALYGAQGDGATDDTAAIRAARAAAQAWAVSSGTNLAWTYYPPGRYLVTGTPVQGGSTAGNAIFTYPVVTTTGQSMIVRDEGPVPPTKSLHWQQTTAQTGEGASIIVTSTAGYSATYGQASAFGGPTPEQGYGRAASLFSNAIAEVNNLAIVLPNNPQISGVDCTGMAAMRIGALAVKPNVAPATSITLPSLGTQAGVQCPDNNNNDNALIEDLTVYGCNYGVLANEHLVMRRLTAIYCVAAIAAGRGGDTAHGACIDRASVEQCNVGLLGNGSFPTKIDVGQLDWENTGGGWWATFAVVNDPSGVLVGTTEVTVIGMSPHLAYATSGGTYCVRGPAGGLNMRVYDMTYQSGNAGTVAVPASGVATINPYMRDVALTVSGGTVTAIAVDGKTLGITSGTVLVPTCRPYTLTYSVAPTLAAIIL